MFRPHEQPAFQILREHLLRGGIAPDQVERCLSELNDHLDDLIAEQDEAGVPRAAAEQQAFERLGAPETLSQAILARRDILSWSARAPVAALAMSALVAICKMSSFGLNLHEPLPAWVDPFEAAATEAVNSAVPVLTAWLLVREADRRRARPLWPLIGIVLLAAASPLVRLTVSPPAMMGARGELDVAFDLFARPGSVLTHVAINLATMATPYLVLQHRRALQLRRAGSA
jgi:hypothetical protein